jgi:hypothetical protein
MVSETSVIFNQLTWLVAKEDVINLSRRESFTSHFKIAILYFVSSSQRAALTERI